MWRTALGVVVGIVVGAAAAVATYQLTAREVPHQAEAPRGPRPTSRVIGSERLKVLEARMDALERRPSPGDTASPVEEADSSDADSSRQDEGFEPVEAIYHEWEEALAEFEETPRGVNPETSQVEARLFEAVSANAKWLEVTLKDVQCRGLVCRASVEGVNYALAREKVPLLLHVDPGRRCESEVVLPPPSNNELPYTAHLIYRCEG